MKKIVLAFLAGILVGVGLAVPAAGPVKRVAKRGLDYWNSRRRYALRSDERPFAGLATSQVGYAPSMRKQFTAPHPFEAFRVVNEADGKVAFVGRTSVRTVQTDILGPGVETVWIGDFSGHASRRPHPARGALYRQRQLLHERGLGRLAGVRPVQPLFRRLDGEGAAAALSAVPVSPPMTTCLRG